MMLGDKLHTTNNENTRFLVEPRQITFNTHVLNVYINFQRKIKLKATIPIIMHKFAENCVGVKIVIFSAQSNFDNG